MTNKIKIIASALISLWLCSCGSTPNRYPITTSLDKLHGEASGQVLRDTQIRLVSIAGLLPDANVGLSNWYRKEKTGMAAVARSAKTANFENGDSILRLEIDTAASLPDLADIQSDIEIIYKLTGNAIAKNIDIDHYSNQLKNEKDNTARSVLNVKISEFKSELNKFNDKLSELNIKVMKAMSKMGGILILTWETQKSSDTNFNILSKFTFKPSNKLKTSGYAILAGIRLSQIMLGNDSIIKFKTEPSGKYFHMNSIVLQSKYILYSATMNLESEILANLDVDIDDLKNADNFLSDGANIKITLLLKSLSSLTNKGALGHSDWSLIPMSSFSSLKSLVDDSDNWKTIYVLKTRRRDLGNWFDKD